MKKFDINQIVKGKVCGFFVVLGYRVLNDREMVQVKPYNPETGETSYGEMAFDETSLEAVVTPPNIFRKKSGYNSFYGEVVYINKQGEVVADGFVIDDLKKASALKIRNIMEGF